MNTKLVPLETNLPDVMKRTFNRQVCGSCNDPQCPVKKEWDKFFKWCKIIRARVRNDYDEMIIVTAYPGSGKSALSWWLGHFLDECFNAGKIALQGDAFIDTLQETDRYGVCINDEPIEGLFSREHNSKGNKTFARWSWVQRRRNLIMIINTNELRWMDPMVRDSRARWAWYVSKRGYATCYMPVRPNKLWAEGTQWVELFTIKFPKPHGPDWDRYMEMKDDKVDHYDARSPKDTVMVTQQERDNMRKEKRGKEPGPCWHCGASRAKGESYQRTVQSVSRPCCRDCYYEKPWKKEKVNDKKK